jgi:hypothetical protein
MVTQWKVLYHRCQYAKPLDLHIIRHTGTTELPLTANGEKRIIATGKALVGDDRLINPSKLAHMYIYPNHHTSLIKKY